MSEGEEGARKGGKGGGGGGGDKRGKKDENMATKQRGGINRRGIHKRDGNYCSITPDK